MRYTGIIIDTIHVILLRVVIPTHNTMDRLHHTATGARHWRYDAPLPEPIAVPVSDGEFPGGAAEVAAFVVKRRDAKLVSALGTALCSSCNAVVRRRGPKGDSLVIATPLIGIACKSCVVKRGNACFLRA